MKHALYLAPFNDLADPRRMVEVAGLAEANGWDGLFLWDHVYRPEEETTDVADVWVMLAAVAMSTTRLRLGPMVTPITRRRIAPLVRQTVTLDHLSNGRLVMGLGLGVDSGRELTAFGEVVDSAERAERLDEGAALLAHAWTGERLSHHGAHYLADDVRFLPRPVQRPRIPLWFAARGRALKPVRRAARYDGLFPIEMDLDTFRRAADTVRSERGTLDGFDICVLTEPGDDLDAFARAGATWAMHGSDPDVRFADVLAVAQRRPPA